jgi:hypothetical protein
MIHRIALFSLLLMFVVISFSCQKDKSTEATAESIKATLTNNLTKTWTLSKLYINGTQQTLTPGQARYTKTFKINNSWFDSDGYIGTYTVPNPTAIQEVTTNYFSGTRSIIYAIKECSTASLDIEYTEGNNTYRLIFTL